MQFLPPRPSTQQQPHSFGEVRRHLSSSQPAVQSTGQREGGGPLQSTATMNPSQQSPSPFLHPKGSTTTYHHPPVIHTTLSHSSMFPSSQNLDFSNFAPAVQATSNPVLPSSNVVGSSTTFPPYGAKGSNPTPFIVPRAAHQISHMPYAPQTSHMPYAPQTSHMPYAPQTSHMPYAPQTSHMPYAPQASHMPYAPQTFRIPFTPQVPNVYTPQVPNVYTPQVPNVYTPQVPNVYTPQVQIPLASQLTSTATTQLPPYAMPYAYPQHSHWPSSPDHHSRAVHHMHIESVSDWYAPKNTFEVPPNHRMPTGMTPLYDSHRVKTFEAPLEWVEAGAAPFGALTAAHDQHDQRIGEHDRIGEQISIKQRGAVISSDSDSKHHPRGDSSGKQKLSPSTFFFMSPSRLGPYRPLAKEVVCCGCD